MYYLGIDLGSSSIKVALIENTTGLCMSVIQEPKEEMPIASPQKGLAGWERPRRLVAACL